MDTNKIIWTVKQIAIAQLVGLVVLSAINMGLIYVAGWDAATTVSNSAYLWMFWVAAFTVYRYHKKYDIEIKTNEDH